MSSLPKLGLGAIEGVLLLALPPGLSAVGLKFPAVSRCLVAAVMAAAVSPAVSISRVEIMESAVTIGLEWMACLLWWGLGELQASVICCLSTDESKEVAPVFLSALSGLPCRSNNLNNISSS